MTFGQRFKIINAGKLLASGTANGTGVMNNEKDALMGSAAFSSDNVMEEDIMNVPFLDKNIKCTITLRKNILHKDVVHKTKVKASVSKRKSCDECGKKFNKISTFSTHMRKIHGVIADQLNQENNSTQVN